MEKKMDGLIDKIDSIREFYKLQKGKRYKIQNHPMQSAEDYSKELYLRMLCSLAGYGGEVQEMQQLLLQRIIAGCDMPEGLEDYFRKALELNVETVEAFLRQFSDLDLKYNFIMDSILLTGTAQPCPERQLEFTAELSELLGIKMEEFTYLTEVAGAIIEQSSERYAKALTVKPDTVEHSLFDCYIKEFLAGTLINTPDKMHFYSKEKAEIDLSFYGREFKEKQLIFENLVITVNSSFVFDGNESVIFRNCSFRGEKKAISFRSGGKVSFSDCTFEGFQKRVALFYSMNIIEINKSVFRNSGYICSANERGGLFMLDGNNMNQLTIVESEFLNCFIAAESDRSKHGINGIIADSNWKSVDSVIIKNNQFIGCQCPTNSNYTLALFTSFYRSKEIIEGNEYKGDLQELFE